MVTRFTHDTTLALPTPDGEDTVEIDVRLHCEGTPGTPEYIPDWGHPENYDPGSGPEITLRKVELLETVKGADGKWRTVSKGPAVKGYPYGDDAIIAAAEAYVDDLPDELIESLKDALDDGDGYDPDLHAEMRADARRACE